MKSKDYWEKRSAAQLVDLLKNADNKLKELKLSYDKAIFNINTSIEKLYGKFAEDNRISVNEAMKIIKGQEYREWRMSMQEYLKRIEHGEEPLQLELDVLAMRSRINRLECLQAEIIANATILAQDEDKTATEHLTDALESSYNNTMYEFYKDKDTAVLDLMTRHKVAISKDSVKEILQIPWSGANYSTRIWKRQFNIANKVKEMVTRNILEGKSINNITREVAKEFGAEYTNALKTLIHTETAFVKSQADKEVYKKLDVEEYEFMATLDRRTSEICRKLDGKHFKVDEAVPGENYPPMHPRCRSTTIRYKPEKYDTHTRIARDKDGKNIKVPLGMKYDEWYEKYIKNGEKGYNISKKQNEEIRSAKEIVKGLPDISEIKTDEDIKKFAEKVIENMGIDASKIDIDIEEIDGASGYCGVSDDATENILHYSEYRLAKNDNRPMKYRIKTAFHEAVHLSANGLTWDGLVNDEVSDSWIMMEETFTESAANYLCSKYGIESKLVPSYPDLLGKILPKLKQVEKYSKCKTIDDFGEIALRDRMNGVGPNWKKLSEEISKKDIPKDYYTQYYDYIEDNKEELVNRFFESSKLPASYRKKVENDLEWAMKSDFDKLPFGHRHIFFSVITCAMKEMGVK